MVQSWGAGHYRDGRPPALRVEGVDLTWWAHQRVILPPPGASHDEQIGVPAESAIRHFLDAHLLAPSDGARAIPVPAALAPAHDPPLGPDVAVRARYTNLGRQIERIALQAGLGLDANRDEGGVLGFGVVAPRDRTAGAPRPVVFSPHHGVVGRIAFVESALRSRNTAYVLGEGQGDTRLVELVTDDADIAVHGRRELAVDARDALDATAARDAGLAELAQQDAGRLRVEAAPSPVAGLTYRRDWDLGDLVTIDLPDLALTVDRRIDAVRVQAGGGVPASIECALGAPRPDATDTLRRLDERTAPGRFQ